MLSPRQLAPKGDITRGGVEMALPKQRSSWHSSDLRWNSDLAVLGSADVERARCTGTLHDGG